MSKPRRRGLAEICAPARSHRGSSQRGFPSYEAFSIKFVDGALHAFASWDLYGAFRARFGYAFDRFLLLDNVLVYLALGGAFGSFTDHMAVQVGPAFISYDQSTTRIRVSKAVGSLGIGAAHPITPNISVFVDYRYTALGPQWAHGRQIDVQLPDGVTEASFGTRAMYHLVRVGANWKFDLGI